MQEERIRLKRTDSANSVNLESFVDVELKHHTNTFPFGDVSETIDQREQFEKERANCDKYRLILTINPYCTNILFNAITEIVQNEGGKDNQVKIANKKGQNVIKTGDYDVKGKTREVNNYDMVRNTEYSNGTEPFVYHCGYDIFNNHILRNQSFKLVNKNKPNNNQYSKDVFNTIEDYMRDANGVDIILYRRKDINKTVEDENRHLYLKDDILSYIDSINANLYEQNGWFGFNNRSSITSTERNKDNKWEDMKIARVFNDENSIACGFIEMYPDSTLYSFTPKYNRLQNREEQNWDICITYPYENDESVDKVLINGVTSDGEVINSLLLADYEKTTGTSGQSIILFRSFVKHNLKVGDKFRLFCNEKNNDGNAHFKEIENISFSVTNIGNLDGEYQDYYFYINNTDDILEYIDFEEKKYTFRFIKVIGDRPCRYYYRKFKKLPNFRLKKRNLTDEDALDKEKLIEYVENNCKQNGKMLLFNKEQYPLAFSNTIYGDGNTQIVFTDSIEVDKLVDNLGRPLTELYITIIKRNKGHDLWYKKSKTAENWKNIEFSHCFSEVDSGLILHGELDDSDEIKFYRKTLGDVTCITHEEGEKLDEDINIDNTDEFYGDVVELDTNTMTETVLSDVYFRFNTQQREHGFGNDKSELDFEKKYDEIITDDYDLDGWSLVQYEDIDVKRPEGYYYKAHYPIKIKSFGEAHQSSHKEIKVSSCAPKVKNGFFVEVVSTLRSGVTTGSIVYLCDAQTNKRLTELTVNSVQSNVRFLLNPMVKPEEENDFYVNPYDMINGLLYSEQKVKKSVTYVKTISKEDYDDLGEEEKEKYVENSDWTYYTKTIRKSEYDTLSNDEKLKYAEVPGDSWIDENGNIQYNETDADVPVSDYGKPKYILRLKNIDIPYYANEIGNSNIWVWRDVLNVGNLEASDLKEYPFANGYFYINKEINFFLKRQDPFGANDLYAEYAIPNDIYGNVKAEDTYEYKEETTDVC